MRYQRRRPINHIRQTLSSRMHLLDFFPDSHRANAIARLGQIVPNWLLSEVLALPYW
jgi:hypothetical protein